MTQAFNKYFWRRGWLLLIAVVSCWLAVWVTPVTAREVSPTHLTQASEPLIEPLIDQGSALFASGQLAAAAQVWQQAATDYGAQNNRLAQARALHYLALAYFNLGQWAQAKQVNRDSQTQLTTLPEPDVALLGAILNLQGQLQLVSGQPEQGIETWQQAAAAYESADDATGTLGAQLNQARALQSLGHYQQSQQILEQALSAIQTQPDPALKATGLKLLGTTLQAVGDLARSQTLLTESLAIVQGLTETQPIFADQASATLIGLGNTLAARQETDAALARYQQAAAMATHPLTRLEAWLNQLQLLVKTEQWSQTQPLISTLPNHLATLTPSRDTVYARVNFAASWMQSAKAAPQTPNPTPDIAQLLATAVQEARSLSDSRAEAFALGQLGHLYEINQQWPEAQQLTQQAMKLAEGIDAPDLRAAWQWQLGRILNQQGETEAAIAAYSNAVESLQSLRQELVALNPDLQFSFLETVEPVYRELVSLLLEADPNQAKLQQARQLIESLQLAELDNFFRHACLQAQPQLIDTVDATAAVLYPIILPDRLAVIVSRPGQPLFHYETVLPQANIEATIAQLQLYLNPHFFDEDRLRLSQQLYDWLIRPAEAVLTDTQTLVFVLDGALRSLPMATLHDGEQYLIERYGIALSPGLQLLEPAAIDVGQIKVLTGGLSEAQQGYVALPAVDTEVNQIAQTLPTTTLLNQTFTTAQLQHTLDDVPFSVIHLATHGQFSSKAEETFLVTWDGRINVKELDALLQPRTQDLNRPLELLVLSACQTAAGDKRAALGLAGIALRSGARSTLATLWQVNDESTATLMVQFYQQLTETPGITKAEALRAAQLSLLKQPQYQHPFYWAPFVLVGNWL
ncbi:MAG: CHAT domain-containing protein [Cyanobacteria bacterium P01_F01_bin.4]